ncbi:MAG: HD domain-containing protein [Patescibacteria group bacterium]
MKKKNKDLDFLYEIGSLRHLNRTWTQFLRNDVANVSEHIFRVTWIAILLAKHEKVKNVEKIIKMALVHDISESRTGDVHYLSRQYNARNEKLAIKDILKDSVLEKEYLDLWHEYEDRKTIEAKIVKDADNLDVDIELNEQPLIDERLRKSWYKIRNKAVYNNFYTKTAKRIWKEIGKSNPHNWHILGRNRFNAGDWKEK